MRVLVRGVGDVGSAVAHRLFAAGYAVAIHDGPHPTTSRRANAFTDAVFDGTAALDGVTAARVDDPRAIAALLDAREAIPVHVGDVAALLDAIRPAVLVDARMRKRATPEEQRGLAPLTIGLGPGFVAGENVDLAVETSWTALGAVIASGPTLPLAGEPRPLAGHARDRFVYAPVAGTFSTARRLGDQVAAGEAVAAIGDTPLLAPLGGTLRGLTRDGVPVAAGTKVIEVDSRGGPVASGLGERPGRIADGVVRAVADWRAGEAPGR